MSTTTTYLIIIDQDLFEDAPEPLRSNDGIALLYEGPTLPIGGGVHLSAEYVYEAVVAKYTVAIGTKGIGVLISVEIPNRDRDRLIGDLDYRKAFQADMLTRGWRAEDDLVHLYFD